MRLATLSLHRFKVSGLVVSAVIATLIMATTASGLWGQTPQLSLADLLIGLRSKKVTLQERNRILAEAVRQRGITFSMSGEIEKELATTGADKELIEAIKHKDAPEKQTAIAKQPADNARAAVPQPVATPTPPDFSFYKSRADVSALKGDFTSALTDYSKSIELKPDNTVVLFSRGQTYFNLRSYDQSVTDFNRVLELNPRDSMAFTNRAMSYEKLGDTDKAMADYQK